MSHATSTMGPLLRRSVCTAAAAALFLAACSDADGGAPDLDASEVAAEDPTGVDEGTAEPTDPESDANGDPDIAIGTRGTREDFISIEDVCGDEEIKVALADGFGGNSWRRISRAEFEDEASRCPNITEVRYTDAQGDAQKAISDLQGLVAEGFDVIVVFPDAGEAMLPAIKDAWEAGVAVLPWAVGESFPGEPMVDYLEVVTESVTATGRAKAEWMVEALGGEGDVVFLGGTPGNPTSQAEYEGIREVLDEHPDLNLVVDGPVDTGWDPAETQQVMSGLLTQYPDLDGVIGDYGLGNVGAFRAFEAAGRPLVPFATQDGNEVSCTWERMVEENPQFEISTVSARNWLVRAALRKGVAWTQGIDDPEPSIVELAIYEDSLDDDPSNDPACDDELPPDAIPSTTLTREQLMALFN